MAVKKIPMRSCCACREKKEKRELVRIVRSPEGEISVDTSGKKPGRGVYVCKSSACAKKAKKSGAVARALESDIPEEIFEKISEETGKNE